MLYINKLYCRIVLYAYTQLNKQSIYYFGKYFTGIKIRRRQTRKINYAVIPHKCNYMHNICVLSIYGVLYRYFMVNEYDSLLFNTVVPSLSSLDTFIRVSLFYFES